MNYSKCFNSRRLLFALLTLLLIPPTDSVQAQQTWPTKPVKIIVPFAPGGTTDVVARVIGQKLGEVWGQPVVIDNRSGAGGNIGADLVAKSPPDGYTLLLTSGSIFTVNPHLYKTMGFDAKRDFIPVTNIASGPMLIVVHPTVPANTVKELVALAQSRPGLLRFGSAGIGSQVHMAGEGFAEAAGIDLIHVPYKGEALAYNDLIGGQIELMVGNIAAAAKFVESGRLRALAVTGRERSPMLPNVPTAIESGLANLESTGWFGFMVPTGTPKEIADKLHSDTARVLKDPDMRARLSDQGMTPVGNTPEAFSKAIAEESEKWARVVKNRKLPVN